ncbi:MAG TPA: hypothetical protein VLX32_13820 [Candidatus Acidoferrum sp.]|nr:hypothetical protein [Candidatus Acidoferrum sp.]
MSARKTALQFLTKLGIFLGTLFAVTVLLAAIPGHHPPSVAPPAQQEPSSSARQAMPDMDHGQMDMSDEKASEHAAMEDMADMHGSNPHMYMTEKRPIAPGDVQRAEEVAKELRAGIAKYRDYHSALNDGYKIFLPNIPQPEYHFTNYKNGFLEAFRFDPSEPTSLLYRKTASGYELVGAMYTMPKRATEQQLDERVPLSIAQWHLHTNLCLPPRSELRSADWTQFGLRGSIVTEEACAAAGGRFHPIVFGWMVHVYPYEDSLDKIFTMHHHD